MKTSSVYAKITPLYYQRVLSEYFQGRFLGRSKSAYRVEVSELTWPRATLVGNLDRRIDIRYSVRAVIRIDCHSKVLYSKRQNLCCDCFLLRGSCVSSTGERLEKSSESHHDARTGAPGSILG